MNTIFYILFLVVALLDPRHPGPYIRLIGLYSKPYSKPYRASQGLTRPSNSKPYKANSKPYMALESDHFGALAGRGSIFTDFQLNSY